MTKRVGIIGYGTIGTNLVKKINDDDDLEVVFIHEIDDNRAASLGDLRLHDINDFPERNPDLVVECALTQVVWDLAPLILKHTNMMIMSNTALADDSFRETVAQICKKHKTKLFVPHGGILGLDGIYDGRNIIKSVKISSDKHPNNFDRDDKKATKIFSGPTKEVCRIYPRNVNVHAALAMAGMGFDKTVSEVTANPNTNVNSHIIEVDAEGIEFRIEVKSSRASKITGVYTLESSYQTIRKICVDKYGINIV